MSFFKQLYKELFGKKDRSELFEKIKEDIIQEKMSKEQD